MNKRKVITCLIFGIFVFGSWINFSHTNKTVVWATSDTKAKIAELEAEIARDMEIIQEFLKGRLDLKFPERILVDEHGELSYEEVLKIEKDEGVKEDKSFGMWVSKELSGKNTRLSTFYRYLGWGSYFLDTGANAFFDMWVDGAYTDLLEQWDELPKKPLNPFTYDSPKTKEFFNEVKAIKGTEIEKVKKIYESIINAIPTSRRDNPNTKIDERKKTYTFEEMLSKREALCREYAMLTYDALKRHKIKAEIISSPTHSWNRVTINGKEYDLDLMWYKDFVLLPPRK